MVKQIDEGPIYSNPTSTYLQDVYKYISKSTFVKSKEVPFVSLHLTNAIYHSHTNCNIL